MTEVLPPESYPSGPPDRLSLDPGLRHCRAQPGLVKVQLPHGRPAWLATRYEDVKMVLSDNRFSRALAVASGEDEPRMFPRVNLPAAIAAMDPPDHTRLRRVIIPAFTARKVNALRDRVQTKANELLDTMVEAGPPADLVEDYAIPLTITMLCDLLGVPREDQTDFRGWVTTLLSNAAAQLPPPPQQVSDARTHMVEYLSRLIAQRRQDPADDLLSAMVHAKDEQDRLTEPELLMLGITVLAAGYDSVASQLVNIFYLLLTEPGRWLELRDSPGLIPRAIEELCGSSRPDGRAGHWPGSPARTSRWADFSCVRAKPWSPIWSISRGPMLRPTLPSGMVCTTVSAPSWRERKSRSPSKHCCPGSPGCGSRSRPGNCDGRQVCYADVNIFASNGVSES